MLVAISGASGFIGSYTVRALRAAGHTVRALVRATSRRDHVEAYVDEWRVGDQADPQSAAALAAGADAVIHNAADWEAVRTASPQLNFERNVLASLRMLDAARLARVPQFLFVSSVAVYHEILRDRPLDEDHPTWPSSVYGAYKAAIEPHLKAYHALYDMNTSAWRPAAVYGIDPDLRRSQWYGLVDAARRGQTIDTPQGGKITHVQDVADALTLAIGDPGVAGQFYNLVDCYMYWQVAGEFAKSLADTSATVVDRKGAGPRNQFVTRKAIDFFTRHGNATALRRGHDGVKTYVAELLEKIK